MGSTPGLVQWIRTQCLCSYGLGLNSSLDANPWPENSICLGVRIPYSKEREKEGGKEERKQRRERKIDQSPKQGFASSMYLENGPRNQKWGKIRKSKKEGRKLH